MRTTSAYSNNLYSVEFFQLVSRHLAECGVLQVWADDQFVLPRTMAEVFPHLVVYALPEGTGFVAASSCPISVDPVRVHQILNSAPIAERSVMSQRMGELRPIADRESLLAQSDGVRINRDFEPVSEYYLGRRDLDRVILERMEPR